MKITMENSDNFDTISRININFIESIEQIDIDEQTGKDINCTHMADVNVWVGGQIQHVAEFIKVLNLMKTRKLSDIIDLLEAS